MSLDSSASATKQDLLDLRESTKAELSRHRESTKADLAELRAFIVARDDAFQARELRIIADVKLGKTASSKLCAALLKHIWSKNSSTSREAMTIAFALWKQQTH